MLRPLHIAIFLPSLRGGGAERVSVSLANELAARGHRVDLVIASEGGAYRSHVASSVNVVEFAVPRVSRALGPLVQYMRASRPAVLLAVMTHCNAIAVIAKWLAFSRTRVIVSEHNSTAVNTPTLPSRLVRRYLYLGAHAVVAVSKGIRGELLAESRVLSRRVVTIYNPLDTVQIQRLSLEPLEHPWVGSNVPFAVAVGSLTPQKDFATLLRALSGVNRSRDLRLVILGEGPLLGTLQTEAAELGIASKVEFLGFQPNPFAWMKHSDVFVLSSRWEGLPGVLLEALACGVKIVSTDCETGPREILESGTWGRLVPPGDADSLASALIASLDDRRPIDVRVRADYFALHRAVDRYEELFRGDPRTLEGGAT